jgi:serine/threonine protein phosphatase PrpC
MEKVGGSCVAACMVVGHRLFVANVGDCEAVLARWQPALEQYQGSSLRKPHTPQSHAHTPHAPTPHAPLTTTLARAGVVLTEKHRVSEKKERERIDNLGGTVIFGRLFGDLSVTRALGDREYKKPVQVRVVCVSCVSCVPRVSCALADGERRTTDGRLCELRPSHLGHAIAAGRRVRGDGL